MNPLIECCEQNLAKGGAVIFEDEYIEKNSDLITYSCINECVLCAQSFYVLFEGERISSSTPEELVKKIRRAIEEWQEEMA